MITPLHVQTIAAVLAECLPSGIQLSLSDTSGAWLITRITINGDSIRIYAENSHATRSMPCNLAYMHANLVSSMQHIYFFGANDFTIKPITPHYLDNIMHAYDKVHTKLLNQQASQELPLN